MDLKKQEILHIGHTIAGTIIEGATIIESSLNGIIGFYYCNDDNKVDEFVGLIQEVSINVRINFIAIVLADLDSKIFEESHRVNKKYDFKYLHTVIKNKDGSLKEKKLETNLIDAIYKLNSIRNSFAHGIIKDIDIKKNGNLIEDYSFKIKDFRPLNSSGKKNKEENIIGDRIEEFCKEDFINLAEDVIKIKAALMYATKLAKQSSKRIPGVITQQ